MNKIRIYIVCIAALILYASSAFGSFHNSFLWWYNNRTGQPGDYMGTGNGIDETNGYYVTPAHTPYWIPINVRPGTVTFNRNVLTGMDSIFIEAQLMQTIYHTYEDIYEDIVRVSVQTNQTDAYNPPSLLSTEFRYYANGQWIDWIDIGFSYDFQAGLTGSPDYEPFFYTLPTDVDYEEYEFKLTYNIPDENSNYGVTSYFTSIDDQSNNTIPEPASIVLLLLSLCSLLRKKVNLP